MKAYLTTSSYPHRTDRTDTRCRKISEALQDSRWHTLAVRCALHIGITTQKGAALRQHLLYIDYRFLPRKNSAKVPGPEWEPITAPT